MSAISLRAFSLCHHSWASINLIVLWVYNSYIICEYSAALLFQTSVSNSPPSTVNWALVFILTAVFRTHDTSFFALFKRRSTSKPKSGATKTRTPVDTPAAPENLTTEDRPMTGEAPGDATEGVTTDHETV
jgi:hypothetical protein